MALSLLLGCCCHGEKGVEMRLAESCALTATHPKPGAHGGLCTDADTVLQSREALR